MAISTQEEQRNYTGAIVAVFLIALVIFFGWRYFFGQTQNVSPAASRYAEIKINFNFLQGPVLGGFVQFPEIKPFEGSPGRENPFLP